MPMPVNNDNVLGLPETFRIGVQTQGKRSKLAAKALQDMWIE
jgi:hypothetical protein